MTIGGERQFGAMSYLLGSPAPRAPLFLGRSFFHILDGFAQLLVALPLALLLFDIRFAGISIPLLLLCMTILSITTNGLGFLMGTVTLLSRDGWMITSTLIVGLYLLIGVNFPVELLPPVLKAVSYGLPMTRGIMAARLVLEGAHWSEISSMVTGEVLVGLGYMVFGYLVFRAVEKASMKNGMLDNI
jgi:ABC-2 type transport system permease protein